MIEAKNGARVLVINAMGRIFMDPLDDPFTAIDRELEGLRARSATPMRSWSTSTARRRARSSRWAISSTAASAVVVGTHTHAPTADHQILPGGTAFRPTPA